MHSKTHTNILMRSIFLSFALLFLGNTLVKGQNYNEILGRPTDTSITVSVMFDQVVNFYFEYGTTSGVYPNTSATYTNVINTPDEIDLHNLLPNTQYYYRTRYKLSGSGTFLASAEHTFHTQRALGSTFTFTIETDEHLYDKKGVLNEYNLTLANQEKDKPDFMLELGDVFGDDHDPAISSSGCDSLHKIYRPILGKICHSIPFYICLGNHEGEKDYYLHQTPPNNMAVYSTLWRKFYYPNPFPNGFYSGNTDVELYGIGNPENYYAWTWGNALFVVMDVYRDDCDTSAKPTKWNWSLGLPQYTWLKNTLEGSSAQYKFVFAHHVSGEGRGGINQAKLYEWGGYEQNGTSNTFTTNRPGWAKPIHQLFVDNGVNIFFQGHDHLFAHEVMDGVIYQECPMGADSTYQIGMLANAGAYTSDTIPGSGHVRVTVSPACVQVDFVRAYLPADTLSGAHHNREVGFSYTIGNCTSGIENHKVNEKITVYPNPASTYLTVQTQSTKEYDRQVELLNTIGETVLLDKLSKGNTILQLNTNEVSAGLYFVKVHDGNNYTVSKVTIFK